MTTPAPRMPDLCNRKRPVHLLTALAILQKLGVDVGRVAMVAEGEYENYRGEIRRQEPKPHESLGNDSEVKLWVGVYTAVDHLPYQSFYGFEGVAQDSEWERRARHLFAPFDAAVLSTRAKALHEGVKYSFGSVDEDHLRLFLKLFEHELARSKEEMRDALLWAGLMPTYYRWAGNAAMVGRVLSAFVQHDVEIIESVPRQYDIPAELQYNLGDSEARLGEATVMGRSFTECDAAYRVKIRQVPPQQLNELLPGGSLRKKLEKLLATCMPGNLEYDVDVEVANTDSQLGSDSGNARLGYSLRLA